jgi:hypothetical protein
MQENNKKAFEQAVAGIEARMAWVERDGKGVEAWLESWGTRGRKRSGSSLN